MLAELSGPDELSDVACQVWWQNSHRSYLARKKIALIADSEAKLKSPETLARLYETILADQLLEIELPFLISKGEHWEL
jgi:hypothetical protein